MAATWMMIALVAMSMETKAVSIKVCDTSRTTKQYVINSPKPCKEHKIETIEKCRAKIYDPNIRQLKVEAVRCRKKIQEYSSYWYFLGYKTHTMQSPRFEPVLPGECESWIRQKRAEGIGEMKEEGEGLYKTNVRVLIRYIYIQEFQGKIENAETRRLNISLDAMTGIMYSPYGKLKGCKLEDGSCSDRVSTIIWDNPARKICEDVRRSQLGPSTTIQILHDPSGRKILKAEKLKMYFEERVKTPKEIRNCSLDGEIISTSNGIQIALENCTSSSTTESIKEMLRKGKPSKEAGRSYRYITYFMDFLEQNIVEYIKKGDGSKRTSRM